MAVSGINKVILIGNLGQDPVVLHTANGRAIANINMATAESWRDKNSGEQKELTEWHRVVLYRKLAEIAGEYLHKGAKVYIEGRLRTRKWQDKNGVDRYTTEIQADNMQMLDKRGSTDVATKLATGNGQFSGESSHSLEDEPLPDFEDTVPF